MKLVFYSSGHGYGHAVRDIEILKSVLKQHPDAEIHFRTAAPQWLFEPCLNDRIVYHSCTLDFGVVQENSFSANKEATLKRYAELIEKKSSLVENEAEFLSKQQPDVILSDITPFAFDAAALYGVKAIAVGNFSWDWIYAAYLHDVPQYEWVVEDIKASYGKADSLWRIPFYGDMSAFSNITDVPLVGRRAKNPRDIVRRRLGIPEHSSGKWILLGLRATDLNRVQWRDIEALEHITFVTFNREIQFRNCFHLQEKKVLFEDVLNACDAVLSKPGYSIVSEVIVNRTPMVYVPRQDFAEDPVLIDALKRYAVCEVLSLRDFYAGHWQSAFERLFSKSPQWNPIDIGGADLIARLIAERMKRVRPSRLR